MNRQNVVRAAALLLFGTMFTVAVVKAQGCKSSPDERAPEEGPTVVEPTDEPQTTNAEPSEKSADAGSPDVGTAADARESAETEEGQDVDAGAALEQPNPKREFLPATKAGQFIQPESDDEPSPGGLRQQKAPE